MSDVRTNICIPFYEKILFICLEVKCSHVKLTACVSEWGCQMKAEFVKVSVTL